MLTKKEKSELQLLEFINLDVPHILKDDDFKRIKELRDKYEQIE